MVPHTESEDQHNAIIKWGYHYLSSHGYALKNKLPEVVLNSPWSYVIRFAIADGYIYLKHTPPLLALEANIIQILHDQFHGPVADVIVNNVELNCFLMKDAGRPLRGVLKKQFDAGLLCKAIDKFIAMQMAVSKHVHLFLDIGVPDWRLDKLPHLYQQLLAEKEMLIRDGLTDIEIKNLEKLVPNVFDLCNELSTYPIEQTIVQPDFNDNNILISDLTQNITFIDLGEISISHPFFSLLNFLHQIKKHHVLTDDTYLTLKEACFKTYMNVNALELAQLLFFIYSALCHYRLMKACDNESFNPSFQRHGKPSVPLKEFIKRLRKE